jgi:hypothetical protein
MVERVDGRICQRRAERFPRRAGNRGSKGEESSGGEEFSALNRRGCRLDDGLLRFLRGLTAR